MFLHDRHNGKHGHECNMLFPQLCNDGCWNLAPWLSTTATQSYVGFTTLQRQCWRQSPRVLRCQSRRSIGWTTMFSLLHSIIFVLWRRKNEQCEQDRLHATGVLRPLTLRGAFCLSQNEHANYWSSQIYVYLRAGWVHKEPFGIFSTPFAKLSFWSSGFYMY